MNVIAQQVVTVTRAPLPWFLDAGFAVFFVLAGIGVLVGAIGMTLMQYQSWREYVDRRDAKK